MDPASRLEHAFSPGDYLRKCDGIFERLQTRKEEALRIGLETPADRRVGEGREPEPGVERLSLPGDHPHETGGAPAPGGPVHVEGQREQGHGAAGILRQRTGPRQVLVPVAFVEPVEEDDTVRAWSVSVRDEKPEPERPVLLHFLVRCGQTAERGLVGKRIVSPAVRSSTVPDGSR